MANKTSIISSAEIEIVNQLLKNATDEQRNAIMRFGAQMYHDGWSDYWLAFFALGWIFSFGTTVVVLLAENKSKKNKDTDNK